MSDKVLKSEDLSFKSIKSMELDQLNELIDNFFYHKPYHKAISDRLTHLINEFHKDMSCSSSSYSSSSLEDIRSKLTTNVQTAAKLTATQELFNKKYKPKTKWYQVRTSRSQKKMASALKKMEKELASFHQNIKNQRSYQSRKESGMFDLDDGSLVAGNLIEKKKRLIDLKLAVASGNPLINDNVKKKLKAQIKTLETNIKMKKGKTGAVVRAGDTKRADVPPPPPAPAPAPKLQAADSQPRVKGKKDAGKTRKTALSKPTGKGRRASVSGPTQQRSKISRSRSRSVGGVPSTNTPVRELTSKAGKKTAADTKRADVPPPPPNTPVKQPLMKPGGGKSPSKPAALTGEALKKHFLDNVGMKGLIRQMKLAKDPLFPKESVWTQLNSAFWSVGSDQRTLNKLAASTQDLTPKEWKTVKALLKKAFNRLLDSEADFNKTEKTKILEDKYPELYTSMRAINLLAREKPSGK